MMILLKCSSFLKGLCLKVTVGLLINSLFSGYLSGSRSENLQRNLQAREVTTVGESSTAEDSPSRGHQTSRGISQQGNHPTEDIVPAEKRLRSIRTQFVNRVSEPNLDKLLDKLLEFEVINDEEMQLASTKTGANKAREVIDTVRRKGTEASSRFIVALREVDPNLSRLLNLS